MRERVTLESPYGEVSLQRYPARSTELLLPFDGADRYLLDELRARLPDATRVLVVGDAHGALTTTLAEHAEVDLLTDSHLTVLAAGRNLEQNKRAARLRPEPLAESYDAVLIRIPKSLNRLRTDLAAIAPSIGRGTLVLAGAMAKHLTPNATAALEDQLGPTTATRGRYKARLLVTTRDPDRKASAPTGENFEIPGLGISLTTAPGTFSSGRLDLGTRALLPHLPAELGGARVGDLGCGNGVLAIASALRNPDATYLLVDESYDAVDTARDNWGRLLPGRDATITVSDGLLDTPPASLDVVLCNPPFHTGSAIEPWFAHRLLDQAARALRPGGRLYVVGNRHLDHERHLRRRFRSVRRLGSTPKFTVTLATR